MASSKGATKSTGSTPYNCNFQQNLIDHSVYPGGHENPDAQPWPSLSPLKFSNGHFRKFKWADTHASKEQSVPRSVIPIEGDVDDPKCAGVGYPFGNLSPLTDGTLAQEARSECAMELYSSS
ncbi:hypothetical protein ACO22_00128 [Paracoccidioides brasiliensis]|uniref:Uncharacterized protein n=1 Tax=Paracoccidioides brasiliensis TaxID=121759 RepID=A0A1D2JQM9_PARBR|nr:hypothetical protein ACO22_00128 [Paracoccidioides brasiliensis]